MVKHKTIARPKPSSAHIDARGAHRHLRRTTAPATRQVSKTGSCITKLWRNSIKKFIWFIGFAHFSAAVETDTPRPTGRFSTPACTTRHDKSQARSQPEQCNKE